MEFHNLRLVENIYDSWLYWNVIQLGKSNKRGKSASWEVVPDVIMIIYGWQSMGKEGCIFYRSFLGIGHLLFIMANKLRTTNRYYERFHFEVNPKDNDCKMANAPVTCVARRYTYVYVFAKLQNWWINYLQLFFDRIYMAGLFEWNVISYI